MALWRGEEVGAGGGGAPAEPLSEVSEVAIVDGAPLEQLPSDLYIPPHALRVFIEDFEGPLDLLLYLVRRRNLDILRVNLVEIADQYIRYIELMDNIQVDLAAEYLVMAATLTELKLRLLLPQPVVAAEDGEDAAAALVLRLRAYERMRAGAQLLEQLPRAGRDFQLARVAPPPLSHCLAPAPTPPELAHAMGVLLRRVGWRRRHRLLGVQLSVRERMGNLLARLAGRRFVLLARLLVVSERRHGVVVNFLAVLELLRERSIEVVQMQSFGPIYLRGGVDGGQPGNARGGDDRQAA